MGFSATIVVTGLCGIVPRYNPPTPPDAFCVVLPRAWARIPSPASDRTSSVDGLSRLRRHAPFIHMTRYLPDSNRRQDLEALWFLESNRVYIEPTFESGGSEPSWGRIEGLAAYDHIASSQYQHLLSVQAAVLSPSPAKVAAQVIVRHGRLDAMRENVRWVFDSYLYRPTAGFEPVREFLNPRPAITLENLASLTIVQRNFGGTFVKSFSTTSGPIFVTVANLCDENPLQWGDAPAPNRLTDDDDFRWHYEIVDNTTDLGVALDGLRCPIPRPMKSMVNGNGLNCIPIRFSAVNFGF